MSHHSSCHPVFQCPKESWARLFLSDVILIPAPKTASGKLAPFQRRNSQLMKDFSSKGHIMYAAGATSKGRRCLHCLGTEVAKVTLTAQPPPPNPGCQPSPLVEALSCVHMAQTASSSCAPTPALDSPWRGHLWGRLTPRPSPPTGSVSPTDGSSICLVCRLV